MPLEFLGGKVGEVQLVDARVFKVKEYLLLGANKRALCVIEFFLVCEVVDVLIRRLVVFI